MSTIDFQHVTVNMVGDVAVVEVVTPELRFPDQAKELGNELAIIAGQDWAKQLVINLKHARYIASTGFAIILQVVKRAEEEGRQVRLCEMTPEVLVGATIIRLDSIVPIDATEQESLDHLSKGSA